ncbi:MAG: metallophosphoesterase [Deltaproteobacteria bacterium]|jgi:3',5'-cyclic AMP phosphodiesterase CpdA|nr:metallophosphoesterase [Deltaproteobacteria bacterium]
MTLIGQISDLHIAQPGRPAYGEIDTGYYLQATVDHLSGLNPPLDALVITGDLAHDGEPEAYSSLARILGRLKVPIFLVPGNHDRRSAMVADLSPYYPPGSGQEQDLAPYLCGGSTVGSARLIFFDGTREGFHGGGLAPQVAAWLKGALCAQPGVPTLVFTHHPPFLSGLEFMDEPYLDSGLLAEIMGAHQSALLCCGHLHRGLATVWAGGPAMVCPSLALNMELDFLPGGGNAFTVGAPAYVLHHLIGDTINTHFCQAPGSWPFDGPFGF